MDGNKQFVLPDPPEDTISTVKFLPGSSNLLLAASWDGFLRIYDLKQKACVCSSEENHPLLDCAASSDHVYYGGLDCSVYVMDLEKQKCEKIGEHMDAVRSIQYSESSRVIVTGSWDASIMVWDTRTLQCVGNHPQVNEVYCMDVRDEIVLVGTGNRRVSIWDLRNMKSFLSERASKLPDYQSRCVKIFSDKKRYALGTIDGRVSIDSIKEDDKSVSVYAFKPHVDKQDGVGHPVNSICILNQSSNFMTGASDKRVLVWDADRKRRVADFCSYPSSISSMDLSSDGTKLAIGCSYTHDLFAPPDPMPPVRIYVRTIKPESWSVKNSTSSSESTVSSESIQ